MLMLDSKYKYYDLCVQTTFICRVLGPKMEESTSKVNAGN